MRFTLNEIKRQSHNKRTNPKTVRRFIFTVLVVSGIIFYIIYQFNKFAKDTAIPAENQATYYPEVSSGVIYHKPYFSLSYVEKYELPEWVSYRLTAGMMNARKHVRDQDFHPDPAIKTRSGHYWDYKSSGYRRGHLVPSADMAWNKKAMDATFLMSNIAPMRESFNNGIWLDLEMKVRDWARKYQDIYVVTGPIFQDPLTTIGDNEILVPRYFYKAVFTAYKKDPKVIGFLFDQTMDDYSPLNHYVFTIDSIEKVTGLDLFSNLYGSWDAEIELERKVSEMKEW